MTGEARPAYMGKLILEENKSPLERDDPLEGIDELFIQQARRFGANVVPVANVVYFGTNFARQYEAPVFNTVEQIRTEDHPVLFGV